MNNVDLLKKLIAFNTTSRNSNLQLIQFIQDYLTKQASICQMTFNADKTKANLFATIPAKNGNVKEGGIVLSGHTDVVPIDGQVWDSHPFEMILREDKLYGRGTSDMKGFLAVMLALVPEFKELAQNYPVHLAFSYDEEVGCLGAPILISAMIKNKIKPHGCIVGEPTSMRPVIAHKGIQLFHCKVQGRAAHSSLTLHGCNSIDYAAEIISYLRSIADRLRAEGPFDDKFDVPFTSLSTNVVHGGSAYNIIPAECDFFFEFRHLPGVSTDEIIEELNVFIAKKLLPKMRKEHQQANITIKKTAAAPSFETQKENNFYQLVCKILNEKEDVKVAYATEAGLFQAAEIPTLVCGPGSIEQAHRPNEFVALEQLERCSMFLKRLIGECQKNPPA